MSLTATPSFVAEDATSLIVLMGPPNRVVTWSLFDSTGSLSVLQDYTDEFGRASAIFSPGEGDAGTTATITAEYGT